MRERLRTGVADALLCLIVVALVVELWITRSSGSRSTVELAAFSGACAVALLVMLLARMAARRARADAAEADRVAAAARESAFEAQVAARAEAVRAAHVRSTPRSTRSSSRSWPPNRRSSGRPIPTTSSCGCGRRKTTHTRPWRSSVTPVRSSPSDRPACQVVRGHRSGEADRRPGRRSGPVSRLRPAAAALSR